MLASIDRPLMKPRCSRATPGATCGSMQSRTALQMSRLSAFVMFNGLVLAASYAQMPLSVWLEGFFGRNTRRLWL
eukprot:15373430-Alexandrium_andersonii.AAC.1